MRECVKWSRLEITMPINEAMLMEKEMGPVALRIVIG